ncbi:MAG TPA: DUF697 domain-containing protein [Xanthobacteraceae bacterium]|jgi:uncharacterized protein (DUF697 family)|nr:DUF697 domain-containing protein [Xanthobacteraceae bacterium]
MTRKPLPKAITQPLGTFRPFDRSTAPDKEAPLQPLPQPPAADKTIEPALAVSSAPPANDAAPAAAGLPHHLAAERRKAALKIVARHKNYAALGGLVPLPVANIGAVTAVNLRMVRHLSALYQVPFERDRTRALIVALVGGAVPTGVGTAASTTLMWVIPGGLLVGLGAAALTAGALTRGIGHVFIESFEAGALPGGEPPAE